MNVVALFLILALFFVLCWHFFLPIVAGVVALTLGAWMALFISIIILVGGILFVVMLAGAGFMAVGIFAFVWIILAAIFFPIIFPVLVPLFLLFIIIAYIVRKRKRENENNYQDKMKR